MRIFVALACWIFGAIIGDFIMGKPMNVDIIAGGALFAITFWAVERIVYGNTYKF